MSAQRHHDTRPAFARFLWRDTTQEHWAYTLSVSAFGTVMFDATVIWLLYLTHHWWMPVFLNAVCN